MEEKYPLILDGETAGEVTVRREGAWTMFDVRCAPTPGILRVSVYGGDREGYLGVLAPEDGALTLHRRLSRSAMKEFPTVIEAAGRAGLGCLAPCTPETAGSGAAEAPAEQMEAATHEMISETPHETEGAAPAEATPETPQNEMDAAKAETKPEKETAPPDIEDTYWYSSPDGALVCFDGENNLIALPVGDPRIPAGGGGWLRTVEGRDYMVYRTKNGRLIR